MRKTIGVALAAAMLLALAALPAAAQVDDDDYPPAAPACALSDTTVPQGGTVGVACEGWAPNTTVTATLFSTPVVLGTTVTDAAGRLSEAFTIPANTAPGPHTLRMSGLNPQNVPTNVDLALTVIDADVDGGVVTPPIRRGVTPSTGLPRTGGDALLALALGVGLLGAGGTALGVARRRNRAVPEVSSV